MNTPEIEMAVTTLKVLANEEAEAHILGKQKINVLNLTKPGTIIWIDPVTGERRYNYPRDRMYSLALFYQEAYINSNGQEIKI